MSFTVNNKEFKELILEGESLDAFLELIRNLGEGNYSKATFIAGSLNSYIVNKHKQED